jgi:hypothetical protein
MALVGHLPKSPYRILVSVSHQRPMADLYALKTQASMKCGAFLTGNFLILQKLTRRYPRPAFKGMGEVGWVGVSQ